MNTGRLIGRWPVFLLIWGMVLVVSASLYWLMHLQHEATVDGLLQQHGRAQNLSWEAVRSQQGNAVLAYFDQHVRQPGTLRWMRLAQDPARRDEARAGLQRDLAPVYAALQSRQVHLFQFHLPDGESLIRFHRPERFGDLLFPVRESLRLVNEELRPIHGFEMGRSGFGYRNVFPIIDDQGEHLGSVEFSVPYRVLLDGFAALWPERELEVILLRDLMLDVVFDDLRDLYQPWPGSSGFVRELQTGQLAGPDRSEPHQRLLAIIESNPGLQAQFKAADAGVSRLFTMGLDYVVARTPLIDPGGRTVGLLVSYVHEPALARLDAARWTMLGLALLSCFLLGMGSHYLLVITAEKLGERRRLGLITRSLGQGLYALDASGVITEVNPRACSLLGYDDAELVGRKAHHLFHSPETDKDGSERGCSILAMTARGQRYQGEQRFRRKDGRALDVSVTSVPIEDMGGSVTLFDDITRQKDNERKLHHIAHFDALTGLPNRVLLADRLAQAMASARRTRSRLALAFLDLDGFKAVNDTFGHETGDRLLVRIARRMQSSLRETDTVARLGGDEFAVVLPDIGDQAAYTGLLDRLLQAMAQPEVIDGHPLQVSASIGVSVYPQREDIDADQLLRQADQAMYEAKLAGKNRYRVFDVARDTDLRGHHEQVERLYRALEKSEFRLYYQPKVNMRSGAVIGAEALIRWQHPERGLLPPSAFLPLINRHVLEVEIGRWVLNSALAQMDRWRRDGIDLEVSINIAGEHLQHPDFVAELRAALAKWRSVPPRLLQLEVVESSALEDITEVSNVIEACAEMGVSVALDDFGTGYSSLTYLKRLPIRTLKLDQSFVRDMMHDPDDLAILDGVLNLARAFGLESIAEGVETSDHGRILLQLGCEAAQGYVIARPMPASGIQSWLKNWRVDPSWAVADVLHGDRREALYAAVGHRAWMRTLEAFLDEAVQLPPEPDPSLCRLGRQLKKGLGKHDVSGERKRLIDLHEQIHALCDRVIKIKRERGRHAALASLPELKARSEEMLGLLDRFIGQ